MKKLLKSEVCGSREQYTKPTSVAEKWLESQIVQLKKKKKKGWKRKRPTWTRKQNTHLEIINPQSSTSYLLSFPLFLPLYLHVLERFLA